MLNSSQFPYPTSKGAIKLCNDLLTEIEDFQPEALEELLNIQAGLILLLQKTTVEIANHHNRTK